MHTEKELQSYKDKAQELLSIFGDKSTKVVEQITNTLEEVLAWDSNEFIAVELGYWYNVYAELTKEPEEDFLEDFESLSSWFIYNLGASIGDDRSLYIDNNVDGCLIYSMNNRGQKDIVYDGKELKTENEFNQVFKLLEIKTLF